jgi:hypothetical protein
MKKQIRKTQLGENQLVEFTHNAKKGQRTKHVFSDQEIQIKPSFRKESMESSSIQ